MGYRVHSLDGIEQTKKQVTETNWWSSLMGQALRVWCTSAPVGPRRNGVLEFDAKTIDAIGLSAGNRVAPGTHDGRCILQSDTQGGVVAGKGGYVSPRH